jgi:class 3 adenylate cyclase
MAGELPQGTVTVLFTDVEGSTDLATSRGDDAAHEILRGQRELVRKQIEEHGGHEVKTMGDGFMVAFDSARRGVACAIGIQIALDEHNRTHPDRQVRVRMGLNTGEAINEEQDLFGLTVTAAERISNKAKSGEILVSDAVRAVLGPRKDARLSDRGRFRLKGFADKWRLYEVEWRDRIPVSAGLLAEEATPFVGRDRERAELSQALDRLAAGRGSLVIVAGEPGVGKPGSPKSSRPRPGSGACSPSAGTATRTRGPRICR